MSKDRFTRRQSSTGSKRPFQIEDIPQVEAEKLDSIEMAAIERAVIERENRIQSIQTDVLMIRSERNALQHQLDRLENEREELRERLRQLEADRPSLEPQALFSDLGSAIGEVRAELGTEQYTIGDVSFDLKANVVQTDEGVRMHLPSLDETFASENLSEISFQIRGEPETSERAEADYNEVPDLLGRSRSTAEGKLAQAGLSVGDVTTVEAPDETPATVIDQFPEPFSLALPDAPVDLTVAGTGDNSTASPTESGTVSSQSDSGKILEEIEEATERGELDPDSELAERLHEADIQEFDDLAGTDPERIATITELPERNVARLHEALQKRISGESIHRLEDIEGIGPTYAERLREAGIDTIAQLSDIDPGEAAEITRASTNRTKAWIEQARSMRAE